jgi:hypothetical protein
MRGSYTTLPIVTRIRVRVWRRGFVHRVRTTIEGKVIAAGMLLIPFLLKGMMVANALQQAELDENAGWVLLWTAHLSMMVVLLSVVSTQTAQSLIVDRRQDALAQYPHARRGMAAFHLWGDMVGGMTLSIIWVFYLFYGGLITRLAKHAVLGTLLHVVGHAAVALVLGALAYRLTLRTLERRPALGRPIYHLSTLVGIFAFFGVAGGPQMLVDLAPDRMAELRSVFDGVAWFFPPMAALVGSTASPGPFLAGLVGIAAMGAVALTLAAPLVRFPSVLLLGEVGGPVTRSFRSLFGERKRPSTHRFLHGTRLFLLKDVLLFPARFPGFFVGRTCAYLGTACLAPYVGWGLLDLGVLAENEAEAFVVGALVLLVCAPAYLRGIGALGSEGHALTLLRPFVRTFDLASYKTVAALVYVVPGGILCGAVVGGLSTILDMRPKPLDAAAIGGLTALVATTFAVSLSFLFPDFERRSLLAPGSSRLGRLTFISVAMYGAGGVAALRWMTRDGILPGTLFVPGLLTGAGMGMALAGALLLLAIRRFPHLGYGT